jgi:hypothetical protein
VIGHTIDTLRARNRPISCGLVVYSRLMGRQLLWDMTHSARGNLLDGRLADRALACPKSELSLPSAPSEPGFSRGGRLRLWGPRAGCLRWHSAEFVSLMWTERVILHGTQATTGNISATASDYRSGSGAGFSLAVLRRCRPRPQRSRDRSWKRPIRGRSWR